jgi:hypothetical protein
MPCSIQPAQAKVIIASVPFVLFVPVTFQPAKAKCRRLQTFFFLRTLGDREPDFEG